MFLEICISLNKIIFLQYFVLAPNLFFDNLFAIVEHCNVLLIWYSFDIKHTYQYYNYCCNLYFWNLRNLGLMQKSYHGLCLNSLLEKNCTQSNNYDGSWPSKMEDGDFKEEYYGLLTYPNRFLIIFKAHFLMIQKRACTYQAPENQCL